MPDGYKSVDLPDLKLAALQARPDVNAIVHCHAPAIEAVSCLESGVMCVRFASLLWFCRIRYRHVYPRLLVQVSVTIGCAIF